MAIVRGVPNFRIFTVVLNNWAQVIKNMPMVLHRKFTNDETHFFMAQLNSYIIQMLIQL